MACNNIDIFIKKFEKKPEEDQFFSNKSFITYKHQHFLNLGEKAFPSLLENQYLIKKVKNKEPLQLTNPNSPSNEGKYQITSSHQNKSRKNDRN
jgi:hypothetical protein